MGSGYFTITFEKELPSFFTIQSLFYAQTGLHLGLKASLHLRKLQDHSSTEIFSQLQQDAGEVAKIEKEQQQYKVSSVAYDEMNKKLSQFSHIRDVQFSIKGFYEVDFTIEENNTIGILSYSKEGYGIDALAKVLGDLGGMFSTRGKLDNNYPEKWKKMKKWHEYKWYNRPKK